MASILDKGASETTIEMSQRIVHNMVLKEL